MDSVPLGSQSILEYPGFDSGTLIVLTYINDLTRCSLSRSAIGSPTYRLAKELACILSPLAGYSNSFVKNSAEFAQEVRDMELGEEDVLLSFDVVSLFTRVPVDEALEVIAQRLQHDHSVAKRTTLEVEDIVSSQKCASSSLISNTRIVIMNRLKVRPWAPHSHLSCPIFTWSILRRWPWSQCNYGQKSGRDMLMIPL